MRPDDVERQLRERLDALGPAPRAELLHVLMLPDLEGAERIGESSADGSASYRQGVKVAWRWLVGGVLAIGVGLAVWPITFILVPAGVVLVAIGTTKWVRSIWIAHSRSR